MLVGKNMSTVVSDEGTRIQYPYLGAAASIRAGTRLQRKSAH